MKPLLDENKVISSGTFPTKSFGFSARRLAHIFDMLSTKTYSDNVAAPMREYATNGVDAMFEAGTLQTRQMEITLPTRFEPMFRVRDYGTGLTPEKIDEVYTLYGESTKEESDDLNGMLGIGSKSAYAYTRSWSIVSFVDGIKTTYNAYVDDAKMPQMATLLTEETDEANGVEILIPVESNDIYRFQKAAARIYSYFTPQPIVHNVNESYPIARPKAIIEGNGWRVTGVSNGGMAIMGNVAYPIDADQVITTPSDEDIEAGVIGDRMSYLLAYYGLEIDLPIGALEFSISRESLYYTNYTKRNLTKRIEEVVSEIAAQVQASIVNQPNLWEAKKQFTKIFSDLGSLGDKLEEVLTGKVFWQGVPVDDNVFKYEGDDTKITYYTKSTKRNQKLKRSDDNKIYARDNVWVVVNDLNTLGGSPARIAELYNQNANDFKGCYLLTFKDNAEKAKFFKETHFDKVPYLLLSQMPKPVVIRNGVGNNKHSVKCFKFNRPTGYVKVNSEAWDTAAIDFENGSGLYVIIDRFEAQNAKGRGIEPQSFNNIVTKMEKMGIFVPDVYAVKPSMLEKKDMGMGWTNFFEWAKEEVEKAMVKKNVVQKSVDQDEASNYSNQFGWAEEHIAKLTESTSPLKQLLLAVEEMTLNDADKEEVKDYITVYSAIGYSFSDKYVAKHNITAMIEKAQASYPLLNAVDYWRKSRYEDELIDYINLADMRGHRNELIAQGC